MDLVEDLADPLVSISAACGALGLSRATLYRHTQASVPATVHQRAPSPRRLSDDDRAALLAVLHSAEFADQPPTEVYATLLGRGVYLASIRTMYRLLASLGEAKERRNQRARKGTPLRDSLLRGYYHAVRQHDSGSDRPENPWPGRVPCGSFGQVETRDWLRGKSARTGVREPAAPPPGPRGQSRWGCQVRAHLRPPSESIPAGYHPADTTPKAARP